MEGLLSGLDSSHKERLDLIINTVIVRSYGSGIPAAIRILFSQNDFVVYISILLALVSSNTRLKVLMDLFGEAANTISRKSCNSINLSMFLIFPSSDLNRFVTSSTLTE